MVLISTITLILAAALHARAADQAAAKGGGGNLDPKSTASIKSIFSSFETTHPSGNARIKPEAVTACCGEGCAIGLCNGRVANSNPTLAAFNEGTQVRLDLAPTATACCSRSCPDGHCRQHDAVPVYHPGGVQGGFPGRPGRPGLPGPLFPGRPESSCHGGCGRECGIACPCVCARIIATSITVDRASLTATTTTTITGKAPSTATTQGSAPVVKEADSASGSQQLDFELTAYFHTSELAGQNQDVLPIVVETQAKEPVTLLADIDLALSENYMSSFFVAALNLSSATTPLPATGEQAQQQPVALGVDAFLVTPYASLALTLLAGPTDALKTYPDVRFNVFDLPVDDLRGKWEPEVFLGVTFLRQARALALAKDFAGQGAVAGVPLLARDVVVSDAAGAGAGAAERVVRDEL
ncbi:hypothetical protein LTR84_008220 [Exophiala bonariae]|uniref:Uncharacterized protein n=1 Tax=Exophiala bonariae TaxID=1690606 RepID=A0AAV9MXR5_9EURO|nr:hypothetical protein LTR84_008220 [Exophiala bonariae]